MLWPKPSPKAGFGAGSTSGSSVSTADLGLPADAARGRGCPVRRSRTAALTIRVEVGSGPQATVFWQGRKLIGLYGSPRRAGHPGGGPDRHVLQMRLQAAGGRLAAHAGLETPSDEADHLGIAQDVLDQPGLVAAAV